MLYIGQRLITGIAFDLEGTVVDLEPLHFAAHVATAKSVGIEIDLSDPKTFISVPHFIGGPHEEVMRDIIDLAIREGTWRPTEHETREDRLRVMDEIEGNTFINLRSSLSEIPPRPGFLEFFAQVKAAGLPAAIGSLTIGTEARIILQKSGLDRLIPPNLIILREGVTEVKPNPEVYRRTAERMGINPKNQLVFEDSHNGVIAAREAGSLVIGMPVVLQPQVLKRLKEASAMHIFTDWKEVSINSLNSLGGTGLYGPERGG